MVVNAKAASTKVSSKGQVIIPKALREARGWIEGTELFIEETADGIVLKPKLARGGVVDATVDDLVGITGYDGPALAVDDMDAAIEALAAKRPRGRR